MTDTSKPVTKGEIDGAIGWLSEHSTTDDFGRNFTRNKMHRDIADLIRRLAAERDDLSGALAMAVKVADEAQAEWDAAPEGMRAGKLIIALSGRAPRYRAEIDKIHATLARAKLTEPPTNG